MIPSCTSGSDTTMDNNYPYPGPNLNMDKASISARNRSHSQPSSSSSSRDKKKGSEAKGHRSRLITTPKELREILSIRYYCSSVSFRHYDEIISGIYLGDMKTARNLLTLEKLGITHILNVAYSPSPFTDRELSQVYYQERNFPCTFLGIAAQDFPSYKIGIYFEETSNFIHDALKSGGKVLIHCQVGVSRSATILIAYLMMKRKMSATQAVTFIGAIRPIYPNEGFLKQICELEYRLNNPRNALVRSLSNVSRRTFRKVFSRN